MKIASLILIILGWLLVALNILSYVNGGPTPPDPKTSNTIAFYIGYNIPLVMSIILLLVGYRLRKKAKRKKAEADLMGDFLTDKPEKTKGT